MQAVEHGKRSEQVRDVQRWRRLAAGGVALGCLAGVAHAQVADDAPSTTPYRPSVSTPAALSAPGWIEVETGFLHQHDGDGRRDSLPTTVKLAFTSDWGIRIGSDGPVHQLVAGNHENGVGDTSVVLKRRFAIDEAQAFGLEAQAAFPTARRGLGSGSGKSDDGVNAIYSVDFAGAWHTDLNLIGTRLGQVDDGASRGQLLWAASLSRALDERWGLTGEFSGTNQHGGDATSQFLVAATCNVTKQLTLDAGAARSLRSGAPVWSAFTGLTWLAVKLF